MNSMLLNVILRTIPRVNANEYEDSKLVIKPRNEWKNDIVSYIILFFVSLAAFILTDKLSIPYVGTFLFMGGFVGIFWGFLMALRAIAVYKYYFELFREEDIKKLDVKE